MTLTKLSGWLLLLFAAVYLIISLMDFGPEYAAAGEIGAKAENYGLQTSETNLRFQMGWEFAIDILIIGVIAIAGWWLTTQEVLQIAWIVMVGLFTIFSIVIRTTPVLPMKIARLSPGAAFFGAQVMVPVLGDSPTVYVPISKKQALRPVIIGTPQGQEAGGVVLDLGDAVGAGQFSQMTGWPVTVKATVAGTSTLAEGRNLITVPLVRVKGAQAGLPQPK